MESEDQLVDWWSDVLGEVGKPEWTAGLLQATLGAAIAFLGALLLFRHQLSHDRALANRQIAAERQSRMADRRAAAADALGRSMLEAVSHLDGLRSDEIGAAFAADPRPAEAHLIYEARNVASLVLDLDETVLELWREWLQTWSSCQARARLLGTGGASRQQVQTAMGAAVEVILHPVRMRVRTVALALIRWDGEGVVPGSDVLRDWKPIPKDARSNHEWHTGIGRAFEEEVSRQLERIANR
jgi:hypothetical protein